MKSNPKPLQTEWPPSDPATASTGLQKNKTHALISDITNGELRDEDIAKDGSTADDIELRDDIEINATESEEFADVLDALNATDSSDDGSIQGLLGAKSSGSDVAWSKEDESSILSEAESAVQKFIDTIKSSTKVGVLSPKSESGEEGLDNDEEEDNGVSGDAVKELIDSVKNEIGLAIQRVESLASSASMKSDNGAATDSTEVVDIENDQTHVTEDHTCVDGEVGTVLEALNTTESGDDSIEMSLALSVSAKGATEDSDEVQTDEADADASDRKHPQVETSGSDLINSEVNAALDMVEKFSTSDKQNEKFSFSTKSKVSYTPKAVVPASPMSTSFLRAKLLSHAKQMVDVYKQIQIKDGFTGPEGEATMLFLSEVQLLMPGTKQRRGSKSDSNDVSNLKADLVLQKDKVAQLEESLASKDELISGLRTQKVDKIAELEESLNTKDALISDLRTKNDTLSSDLSLLHNELDSTKESNNKISEMVHNKAYKERDDLKKWKGEAEATLRKQSKDLDQLISQNSTLLDLCNEKEDFIRDLSQFKAEAEGTIITQENKLSELSSQASNLLDVCGEQQSTIKDLKQWKSEAEKTLATQSSILEELTSNNSTLSTRCKEQSDMIEELTAWKDESTDRLKRNKEELSELSSDNSLLLTKCNEQEIVIEKNEEEIEILKRKLEVETFAVQRFEEDFLEHSKNMMTLKESIKNKTNDITRLTAKIDDLTAMNQQLAEQVTSAPDKERAIQEKEKMAMKMNHHKEISQLKNTNSSLTSKIASLVAEQQELREKLGTVNGNAALLEDELQRERMRHKETKQAVEGMEKALVVSI
eukprot:scaffold919_cov74-Cyclotella_meneghiniana.AAC.2